MSSAALGTWQTTASSALDEIAGAHAAVGGTGPGRRHATEQIDHAYAVLVCSQFQRFCRDLHTECVSHLVSGMAPAAARPVIGARFLEARKLDRGNPNPGNLGSDFGRFGIDFWGQVRQSDQRNQQRQSRLHALSVWRNAIAHQDFDPGVLDPKPPLTLGTVRRWRSACGALAVQFDRVMGSHLTQLVGTKPW